VGKIYEAFSYEIDRLSAREVKILGVIHPAAIEEEEPTPGDPSGPTRVFVVPEGLAAGRRRFDDTESQPVSVLVGQRVLRLGQEIELSESEGLRGMAEGKLELRSDQEISQVGLIFLRDLVQAIGNHAQSTKFPTYCYRASNDSQSRKGNHHVHAV
jgi:hypothetical protein